VSPFNYQQPISDVNEFYGRKNIVSKIYARIGASRPQSVSIVGDYKIGKTSLLSYLIQEEIQKQYLNNIENYVFIFISIKNYKTKSLQDFVQALCSAVSEKMEGDFTAVSIKESYAWYKQTIEALTKKGLKFVLFLDDFNLVTQNSDFPLEFFSFLRSLANNFNVAYVTTSYQDLQKLCVSKEVEESPFFNIFTNITLRAFEPAVVNEFITKNNLSTIGKLDSPISVVQEYTGGFPFLVQMAGEILRNLKENHPDADLKQSFKKQFYEKSKPFFLILWGNLDDEDKTLLVRAVSKKKISESQQYMIKILLRKSYLMSSGKYFKLFSPAFNKFLLQEKQLTHSSFTSELFNKIMLFFGHDQRKISA